MSEKVEHIINVLIAYFKSQEIKASEEEKKEVWKNIESVVFIQSQHQKKKRYFLYASLIAAVILFLLVLVPFYFYTARKNHDYLAEYAKYSHYVSDSVDQQIKLILSDKKERFVKNEATVSYSKNGVVVINQDTIKKKQQVSEQKKEIIPNQIIIPKGRRSKLALSDGSQLWINAGTRVIYPPVFEKDKREIYVEGEIYLEVAHDENCPFYVKTKDFNVEVLGTKFNVSAYQEDETAKVVLVDGSVKVSTSNHKTAQLTPNHLVDIYAGKLSKPIEVDVNQYVSWIDNMLIYKDEPLSRVIKKLNLYYGVTITADKKLAHVLVSGKLDLKEDIKDVLHTISYSAPVKFINQSDKIKAVYVK